MKPHPDMRRVGATALRVLAALCERQDAGLVSTLHDLCAATGRRGPQGTHRHLYALRELGLVSWERWRHGTLRANYRLEAV